MMCLNCTVRNPIISLMGVCACQERACEFDQEGDKGIQTELLRRYLTATRASRHTMPPFKSNASNSSADDRSNSLEEIDDFIQFDQSPAKKTLNRSVGVFKLFKRPRVKLENQFEETINKAKPLPYQAYAPQDEPQEYEVFMELKRHKLHFLRSPAPRLSEEHHQRNLLGLLTEEEEFKGSPMRKSVTYSPASAMDNY